MNLERWLPILTFLGLVALGLFAGFLHFVDRKVSRYLELRRQPVDVDRVA